MEFKIINKEQAMLFPGFMVDDIPSAKEENLICAAALEEGKGLVGLAVCSVEVENVAELLSIAVTEEFQGKKIGTRLLEYLKGKLYEAGIRDMFCQMTTEWNKQDDFDQVMAGFGFRKDGKCNVFNLTIGELAKKEIFTHKVKNKGDYRIVGFEQLPTHLLNALNNRLEEEGEFGPIYEEDYQKELCRFALGEEILGCLLISEISDKLLDLSFLYTVEEASAMLPLELMVSAYDTVRKKYSEDTTITISVVNDKVEKLVGNIIFHRKPDFVTRLYTAELHRDLGDFALEPVDMSTLPCSKCKFAIEGSQECEKYSVKPGCIYYGKICSSYQRA